MDRHIDLHEKMLSTMQHSFKKVRKRIHKVELSMHLKPPDTEVQEVATWKKKVDNLLSNDKVRSNYFVTSVCLLKTVLPTGYHELSEYV